MKKTLICSLILTLVLAFAMPQAFAKHHAGMVVNICHFPGHKIDGEYADYAFTNEEEQVDIEIAACLEAGGSWEVVGVKACEKGHRIAGEMCSDYSYPEDEYEDPED